MSGQRSEAGQPADAMQSLLDIMARLRDPLDGCPWDIRQTFDSIVAYTIEEAYEVADAIDRNDMADLKDELGDLLLQVVFHARIAEEQGAFGFADVVAAITDKMVRRHPHVFAGEAVADAEAQTLAWERHKQRERSTAGDVDGSALAGIHRGLPEWQRAMKLQKCAARTGFDWRQPEQVIGKLHEEIEEVRHEFARREAVPGDPSVQDRLEDEIGDLLFVAANLARHAGVDVGSALRRANRKFERRFRAMETLAAIDGTKLDEHPIEAQEAYWGRVKAAE